MLADAGELWKLDSLILSVTAESQPLEHELTTLQIFQFFFCLFQTAE